MRPNHTERRSPAAVAARAIGPRRHTAAPAIARPPTGRPTRPRARTLAAIAGLSVAAAAVADPAEFGTPAPGETPAPLTDLRPVAGLLGDDQPRTLRHLVATAPDAEAFLIFEADAGDAAIVGQHHAGFAPNDLAAADLDRDGDTDLLILSPATDRVRVVWNRLESGGGYELGPIYVMGRSPLGVCVGDFNADGYPDFATANRFDHEVRLALSDGAGLWSVQQNALPTAWSPWSIVAADLDGDGRDDLVTTGSDADAVAVHFAEPPGSASPFRPAVWTDVGDRPTDLVAGDFDGDGDPDLAVIEAGWSTVSVLRTDRSATGATLAVAATHSAGLSAGDLRAADLDNDGADDLSLINATQPGKIVLLMNETDSAGGGGGGTGVSPSFARTEFATTFRPRLAAPADLDGDFLPELLVTEATGSGFWSYPNTTPRTQPICPGDLDGDLRVNATELLLVLSSFGSRDATPAEGDATGDGVVDADDLLLVLANFGAFCGED